MNFFLDLLWESFFCRETFSFGVRHILSLFPWGISFPRETFSITFSFLVRMFLLKILLPKVKICRPYKKDLAGYVAYASCCEQDLFYSLEKEQVQRRKKFREQKDCLSRQSNLWLVLWARPFYSPGDKDSLKKRKI